MKTKENKRNGEVSKRRPSHQTQAELDLQNAVTMQIKRAREEWGVLGS